MSTHGHPLAMTRMWQSGWLMSDGSFLLLRVPEIELSSADPASGAFTDCAISPAQGHTS